MSKPANFRNALQDFPDDEKVEVRPPIRVTSSISLQSSSSQQKSLGKHAPRDPLTILPGYRGKIQQDGDWLRVGSSLQGSQTSLNTTSMTLSSINSAPSVPEIRVDGRTREEEEEKVDSTMKMQDTTQGSAQASETFHGITLDIPTGGFSEEIPTNDIEFSKRGSMYINGEKLNQRSEETPSAKPGLSVQQPNPRTSSFKSNRAPAKILSTDEELLSEKVRSFYMYGGEDLVAGDEAQSKLANNIGLRWQDAVNATDKTSLLSPSRGTSITDVRSDKSDRRSIKSGQGFTIPREETELAGGLEDWQDLDNSEVDRYGFIIAKPSQAGTKGLNRSLTVRDQQSISRVSTSLQIASETPRRRYTLRRSPSSARNTTQAEAKIVENTPEKSLRRSSSGPNLNLHRRSTLRVASNKLPQNRDRRIMDDAAEMLTLPSTGAVNDDKESPTGESPRLKKKEIQREEKWRRMAKVVSTDAHGAGMMFEFDTKDPKLIERTWKGIPDRWRATAWYAFLSASAKRDKYSPSDQDLIDAFHEYQDQSSPDDVQIDIDVPRTISGHIMFRRRYRGGQRLLFRVLHAMSLHYTETGYVQGMAALAATILAYYEEEKAFIMLVRLWDLRGLENLYKAGFGGLMAALDDLEKNWLGEGEVAKKLTNLGITPTAYGTRWYLTLFNYSIPFPAQLRVWDVFMLLGDDIDNTNTSNINSNINNHPQTTQPTNGSNTKPKEPEYNFGKTLDILHATSAALIEGMRDILLQSDFENAMKVLTSWIPVRDEDLFMKVAKAEWKVHKRKALK